MIQGIEHTAIASPDPQKLAQWYVDHLDFTINYNSGRTVFVKAPNGYMLEIITSEGARGPQTMKDPLIAMLMEAPHEPTHLSWREAQQSRCLLLKPLSLHNTMQNFQPVTLLSTHLDPLAFLEEHRHGTSLPEG